MKNLTTNFFQNISAIFCVLDVYKRQTIFCVIVGLLFSLFSATIVSQFTTGNVEMIKIGASSLRINGITFMLFGFYTVYSSLFLALGKGKAVSYTHLDVYKRQPDTLQPYLILTYSHLQTDNTTDSSYFPSHIIQKMLIAEDVYKRQQRWQAETQTDSCVSNHRQLPSGMQVL